MTFLPHSQAEINVTIPFSEFQPRLEGAARIISEEIDIPGFRPGKAPYDIVKNRVGEMKIYEQAADAVVRKTFPDVLREYGENPEKKFAPIGKPEITVTKLAPGNDFEYKAVIALLPEIELPDYKTIARRVKKEKKEIFVKEEEIEKTIQWIRESRAPLVTVARNAQKGDSVEIDFSVRHNGVLLEGGESKNHPLVIGQNKFLPGFDEQIIGMHAGDEKTFDLLVPEDWQDKSFAGKTLALSVSMKLVQERQIPELTEKFTKSLGNFASLDALKKSIESGIREEKENKEKQRIRSRIIEEIAKEVSADIPDALIQGELNTMLAELASGVQNMGMQWEDYLSHIQKREEDLEKEWGADAEKRVKIALILREIARQEKINPSEEEVLVSANKILSQYSSPEDAKKSIDPAQLKEYTRGIVKNEKVFEFLENISL